MELFASYVFTILKETQIDHYVYDPDKFVFNKNILDELKKLGEIEKLVYCEKQKGEDHKLK